MHTDMRFSSFGKRSFFSRSFELANLTRMCFIWKEITSFIQTSAIYIYIYLLVLYETDIITSRHNSYGNKPWNRFLRKLKTARLTVFLVKKKLCVKKVERKRLGITQSGKNRTTTDLITTNTLHLVVHKCTYCIRIVLMPTTTRGTRRHFA